MKIAISNIAWERNEELKVFSLMKRYHITGLEIAPTKIWNNIIKVKKNQLEDYKIYCKKHSISIVAMQSLLYKKVNLKIFGTQQQRLKTQEYLKKIIDIAGYLQIPSLVFGSPLNRAHKISVGEEYVQIGRDFFSSLAEYAASKNTYICIEPNPKEYQTNFLNTTAEAREFVKKVNHSNFKLHLDSGAMILNKENISEEINASKKYIHHFHISNPYITSPIDNYNIHKTIAINLKKINYKNWVSVEMKSNGIDNYSAIDQTLDQISRIYSA